MSGHAGTPVTAPHSGDHASAARSHTMPKANSSSSSPAFSSLLMGSTMAKASSSSKPKVNTPSIDVSIPPLKLPPNVQKTTVDAVEIQDKEYSVQDEQTEKSVLQLQENELSSPRASMTKTSEPSLTSEDTIIKCGTVSNANKTTKQFSGYEKTSACSLEPQNDSNELQVEAAATFDHNAKAPRHIKEPQENVSLSILAKTDVGNMSDEELERALAAFEDEANVCHDDDDAAVYLQELGINFGLSGRSSRSRISSRTKLGPGIQRVLRSPRCGSSSGWSAASASARRNSTKTLVETSLHLSKRDDGAHMYRLLSAKRNHIQELSNDAVCLQKKIKELEDKNRLLVRLCKRQEAELRKFHEARSELPHLLEAHKMEILVLQDRLRKLTEAHRRDTSKLRQQEERLFKTSEETTRLKELTKKRNLPEREELNRKLCATQCSLAEKQQEVDSLQKRLALVEKSSRQQVSAEEGRHRATTRRLQALRRDHRALQKTLQERDKELAAVQHYRSRAMSALNSKGARGSTSNLSTSSTTGFSSMHMSSASSRSTSLSAHPGGRAMNASTKDGSCTDQEAGGCSVVQSDAEGRGTVTRTKSGRMLPPISGEQQRGMAMSESSKEKRFNHDKYHQEGATTRQVGHSWHSQWWSRSQEEDSQTYMILSSPEPLSSTSPMSGNDHHSPTRLSKSAAAPGVLQLSLDQAVNSMRIDNSQILYNRLNRANMPSNTLHGVQCPAHGLTRKTTYNLELHEVRCSCDEYNDHYGDESQDCDLECLCRKHENTSSFASQPNNSFFSNQQTQNAVCPVEFAARQVEQLSIDDHTPNAIGIAQRSTLSSTPEECHEEMSTEVPVDRKCSCGAKAASPQLVGSIAVGSRAEFQKQAEDKNTDADRKDSNTSNITDVSCLTTTSDASKISDVTEHSAPTTSGTSAAYVRRRSSATDQFSLIEKYPPKERRKLQKEVGNFSAGSDTSGSGPSPPPVRGVPNSAARYRPPPSAKLSRQNSVGLGDILRHKHTVSLTHLDTKNQAAKVDDRAAITP
ncbi:uncharacterized protein LOC108668383 [Hyalella azteca]|uniref:Uncharacterized protein LOC108668383 n=1 Tax=Hyalella azteca TaxID=294128 RepID=A0A8B7NBW1_HYAAZ|nr:uncharacterized protein LOC108668383 [Hyalella azteca]